MIDYISTKTALIGLTRASGVGGGSDGRYMQRHLSRGPCLTPADRLAPASGDAARRHLVSRKRRRVFLLVPQPSRKFSQGENVAGLVAFLCGPHGEDINGSGTADRWRLDRRTRLAHLLL